MTISYVQKPGEIDWEALKNDLIQDDFHNGRTTSQLRQSFENSQLQVYAIIDQPVQTCIGTARALSDGVGNAYVIDVWTRSDHRGRGIATSMMQNIMQRCTGQHIFLQTDDAIPFYRKLGFADQPLGMSLVVGQYLSNDTRDTN